MIAYDVYFILRVIRFLATDLATGGRENKGIVVKSIPP